MNRAVLSLCDQLEPRDPHQSQRHADVRPDTVIARVVARANAEGYEKCENEKVYDAVNDILCFHGERFLM
jgi:hypothetical protein